LTTRFDYEADFRLPAFLKTPAPGSFAVNFGLGSALGIASVVNMAAAPQRTLPFRCMGGIRKESTQLHLPDTWNIAALPAPVKYESRFGVYESSYALNGHTVNVQRTLDLHFPQATCLSTDYPQVQALADVVSRDLRAQLSYH
jgi:hypothetical protein